jgi:hypothetical protein
MIESLEIAVEFFKAVAWPLAAVAIVYMLRGTFQNFIDRIRLVTLKGYGGKASFTIGEVQDVLQQLVQETVESAKGLDDVEGLDEVDRRLFNAVRNAKSGPSVQNITEQVFGADKVFSRRSDEHKHFQELRDRNLIRPEEGGSWKGDKHPVLTGFARVVLKVKPTVFDEPQTTSRTAS